MIKDDQTRRRHHQMSKSASAEHQGFRENDFSSSGGAGGSTIPRKNQSQPETEDECEGGIFGEAAAAVEDVAQDILDTKIPPRR